MEGHKQEPTNYRSFDLLDTTLKLVTKVITNNINSITKLKDKQQGFRLERSSILESGWYPYDESSHGNSEDEVK